MEHDWWKLSWQAWLSLGAILAAVVSLTKYNLDNAQAKARDWNRLDQIKFVYKQLSGPYLRQVGSLPPHTEGWQLTGCGGRCPLGSEDITSDNICNWRSGVKSKSLACSDESYITPLPALYDNPQTSGPDQVKYKRLSPAQAVLEVCLEKPNSEASTLDQSLIGWRIDECPSGLIFIWPEAKAR